MHGSPAPVLYVSHESGCGGGELSLLTLLSSLDRARFPPLLVTSGDGELARRAQALGVPCAFVKELARTGLARAVRLPSAARAVAELCARHAAKIVHSNTLVSGYVALLAARARRVPALWHVRDIGYPLLARCACARAARIVANSRATAQALRLPAKAQLRLRVVFNGVGAEFFAARRTGALRAEIGASPADLLVGMIARRDPWKGHEELLHAASRALAAAPSARFVLIGGQPLATGRAPAPYAQHLATLARDLGIAARVHFLEQRSDVAALLGDLDIVAHPVREPEPFGRVVAEAFAAGKPVVASACGGIVELIGDGTTGLLVRPRDADGLAAALVRLLREPGLRDSLGERARAFARAELTAERHAQRVAEIYEDVLSV